MAFSNKQGREYQSRRERGYKPTKYSKGYDRWGMPIICGLIDADGNECLTKTFSYGLCDKHQEERDRKLGRFLDRPEFFETRST